MELNICLQALFLPLWSVSLTTAPAHILNTVPASSAHSLNAAPLSLTAGAVKRRLGDNGMQIFGLGIMLGRNKTAQENCFGASMFWNRM